MLTTTWRRLNDDSNEYVPGRDSPENYYINDDVINFCVHMLSHVTHRNEPRVDDIRTAFVYGVEPPPNLPYTLTALIIDARRLVCLRYVAEWRRDVYREELAAIFDAANKAR